MGACHNILESLPPDNIVSFSDEAHFHLSSCVNKQNFRYCSALQLVYERPLHSERVTVWCAVSRAGNIWPHFFEDEGVAVTFNSNRYANMIEEFVQLALQMRALENVWFQQDSAARTAGISMRYFEANLFWSVDFFERWCCLASTFTRFNTLRSFLMGILEGRGVQTSA